jgi:hypothetical protein
MPNFFNADYKGFVIELDADFFKKGGRGTVKTEGYSGTLRSLNSIYKGACPAD